MDVLDADAGRFFRSPHQVWKASSTASKGRPTTQNIQMALSLSTMSCMGPAQGARVSLERFFPSACPAVRRYCTTSSVMQTVRIHRQDSRLSTASFTARRKRVGRHRHSCSGGGCGTVFKMSTSGTEEILYPFRGYPDDGSNPNGYLTLLDGKLYGTTEADASGYRKVPVFQSHRERCCGAVDSLHALEEQGR